MDFNNDSNYFDQHFLVDNDIINTFINCANLTKDDIVVEIGPGKGNISQLISKKVKKLYCIELDERLKPFLNKLTDENNNIEVIYGNALDISLPECNKVITALPYSIIEPFINKMINYNVDIYMIMGKKYVDNVLNNEITKLSLLTNCYYECTKIMDITPDKFEPKPRVMSSIVKLKYKDIKNINDKLLLIFRYMFYYKNKKTKNALIESLINSSNNELTQRLSKDIINNLNIDEEILNKNFETLSNSELKYIYKNLENLK